jgi:hypothetical protein
VGGRGRDQFLIITYSSKYELFEVIVSGIGRDQFKKFYILRNIKENHKKFNLSKIRSSCMEEEVNHCIAILSGQARKCPQQKMKI